MENLNLVNNNIPSTSAMSGTKLLPVVTKKYFGENSPNTLNNLKKLPTNSGRLRSMPITREKEKVSSARTTPIKKVIISQQLLTNIGNYLIIIKYFSCQQAHQAVHLRAIHRQVEVLKLQHHREDQR